MKQTAWFLWQLLAPVAFLLLGMWIGRRTARTADERAKQRALQQLDQLEVMGKKMQAHLSQLEQRQAEKVDRDAPTIERRV